MALNLNDPAPPLPGHDYTGKWTLVYFYPADFTPGCTKEACNFRDNFSHLSPRLTIIGVSPDSAASHTRFKTEYNLPFKLLADPDRQLITGFGADGLVFTKRSSFLISPQGRVVKIYNRVDPSAHAAQVIADLNQLQASS